jgi:phytoene dehydrogenase-like protein
MAGPPRTPPRFVPTLTTVLELPPHPPPAADETPAPPEAEPSVPAPAVAPAEAVALSPQAQVSEIEAFRMEEQLLHRVLQRIDLSLEEQLSDAVSAAVQQHLDTMIPRLRDEIEVVLRTLVSEALARELSETPGSTPPFGA